MYAKFLKIEDEYYHFHYWTVDSNQRDECQIDYREYGEVKIRVRPDNSIRSYCRVRKPWEQMNTNKYRPGTWVLNDAEPIIKGILDYVVTMEAERAIFNTEHNEN